MKKVSSFVIAIVLAAPFLHAQDTISIPKMNPKPVRHNNIVKVNLLALGLKTITIQYERVIGKKTTFAVGLRMMPEGTLPFEHNFGNFVKDSTTQSQLNSFKTGNFAVMPEIRFYLSRKGAYHGFYIAPFLNYSHYTATLPYNYTNNGTNETILISGSTNSISAGLMFGAQWKLGKSLYLDWWIFGPNYGSAKGSLSGSQTLSPSEQTSLKSNMDDLHIPLVKTTSSVNAEGAILNFSGPWAGIRSGLCIGFRF